MVSGSYDLLKERTNFTDFSLVFWLKFPDTTAKAQVFSCVNQHDSTEVRAAMLTYTS